MKVTKDWKKTKQLAKQYVYRPDIMSDITYLVLTYVVSY